MQQDDARGFGYDFTELIDSTLMILDYLEKADRCRYGKVKILDLGLYCVHVSILAILIIDIGIVIPI